MHCRPNFVPEKAHGMALRSRAPTRIDFAGGTTDLPAFAHREGGAVFNAAIARYAYASLRPAPDGRLHLHSQDLDEYIHASSVWELEFDGHLDLLKAACQQMGVDSGLNLTVRCDAPRGSGLGASASVGVALVALLDAYRASDRGRRLSRFEIADLACALERQMGIVGGKQDQFAAALGGFSFMRFEGETVLVEPLNPPPELVCELEKHLILAYTGQSRLSGEANQRMISAYQAGHETVAQALRTVKSIAEEIYHALLSEDLSALPELLNEEWQARRKLAEGIVTPQMEKMREAAFEAGARAAKVCGAGGGGCVLFYVKPDREAAVRRALQAAGAQPLDFVFDFTGLVCWRADDE